MQFVFQYNITFSPLHDEQYSHCERFARNEGLSVVDIYNDLMVCAWWCCHRDELILTPNRAWLQSHTLPCSKTTWKAITDCPGIGQVSFRHCMINIASNCTFFPSHTSHPPPCIMMNKNDISLCSYWDTSLKIPSPWRTDLCPSTITFWHSTHSCNMLLTSNRSFQPS